jgi:hypothetical protein
MCSKLNYPVSRSMHLTRCASKPFLFGKETRLFMVSK